MSVRSSPRDHYDMADLPDEMAAELGLLSTHIVRHVEALPHISRAHSLTCLPR
jgi:hypothetical protein